MGIAILSLFLFGAIITRGGAWWARMVPLGKGSPMEALVESGQNALSVSRSLVEQGLTTGDARALARWFSLLDMDTRLKPGLYRIRPGTPWEVAKQMNSQEPDSAGIPGTTIGELGTALSPWGGESALLRELSDPGNFPARVRGILPEKPEYRLAFLLPETYRVTPSKMAINEFVRLASNTWLEKIAPFLPPDPSPRWLLERAILASINERESRDDRERPRVAGVFENRLRLGMPLQSCATVVFAWKLEGRTLRGLTYADLEIDSPYNTYRNGGLPPGPIGVPSLSAWQASLAPEHHEYLFFVLSPSGRHLFSRTYEEHLAAQKSASEDRPKNSTGRENETRP
jgi:UPF0755 protein